VAYHYVGGNRDQLFLMPVSMRDWLDEGHLGWFMIDVVANVDTTAFHARHPNDGPGRPAYHPDMMLALLFYAYAMGLRSSRRIESACRTDAAYRVICGGATPDHATIARFLVDHETAIEGVFVDGLRLCAAAGLVSVGTIAIDGTKTAADAALDANRDATWIRAEVQRMLAEAITTDQADDTHPDLFAIDGLPAELANAKGRLARLGAALALIEAEDAAIKAAAEAHAVKAQAAAAEGRKLIGKKPKDPHAALARAEADVVAEHNKIATAIAERAAQRAALEAQALAQGRKPNGFTPTSGPRPREKRLLERVEHQAAVARAAAAAAAPASTKANVTDADSRIMKTATGWIQGYNAQVAVNEHQIVIGHSVTQDANDLNQYQPMVAATRNILDNIGIAEPIGIVLADAGYWSDDNATAEGPDRLIATLKDWKQRQAARDLGTTTGPAPEGASVLDAMEHRLRTTEGAAEYSKRSHTVEPVFGDIKENRGFRRFRRRGLTAVRSEWALINLSHNLAKVFDHSLVAVT
jgi:transposase